MAEQNPGGCGDNGYLKVQRHPRTSILSFGFALVTLAAFDAALTVPSVSQAALTGYKAPLKRAIQTQPQDGWQYTAATPTFDATVTVAPVQQSQWTGYQFPRRTARQTEPQTGWLETATHEWAVHRTPYSLDHRMAGRRDAWRPIHQPDTSWLTTVTTPTFDPTLFQAPVSERTPTRAALRFRYPLASAGFSTDGSTPAQGDTWDASKFQQTQGERPAKRRGYDPRYDFQKSSFALLDARVVQPAIEQLASSDRMGIRDRAIPETGFTAPFYPILPVTDVWTAAKTPYVSFDRMADRRDVRMEADLDALGWLYSAIPPADVWNAAKFQNGSGERTGATLAARYRLDGYPETAWLYPTLPTPDVWSVAKFQNNSGERTPARAALAFRYPLLTTGFSTDGSSPATGDVWNASKFQANLSERMGERVGYDPRLEHHKFSFGLLDARAVMPAIAQLMQSERAADRYRVPLDTPDAYGWLGATIPTPFDPRLLPHTSDDRLRDRYRKTPLLDQPSQAWITTAIPPFDPQFFIFVNAPDRMGDRHLLDLWASEYVYHLAWLHDVIPLTDTELRLYHKRPIAPIVNRKRRRRC